MAPVGCAPLVCCAGKHNSCAWRRACEIALGSPRSRCMGRMNVIVVDSPFPPNSHTAQQWRAGHPNHADARAGLDAASVVCQCHSRQEVGPYANWTSKRECATSRQQRAALPF
eukprot:360078-Chlamydomonas_euryale.AAC.3